MPLETVTGRLALPTALLAITSKADRLARTDGGACQSLAPVYPTPPPSWTCSQRCPYTIYSTTPTYDQPSSQHVPEPGKIADPFLSSV